MFVSVNETWNISLNDPETEKYKNFSRDVIKQVSVVGFLAAGHGLLLVVVGLSCLSFKGVRPSSVHLVCVCW